MTNGSQRIARRRAANECPVVAGVLSLRRADHAKKVRSRCGKIGKRPDDGRPHKLAGLRAVDTIVLMSWFYNVRREFER
jgi:hypothetical protein